ncbi:MAG TPA: chromosomal replication initiator protein DnaA [Candidatus Limnocylindrales bacterium]|nr:chromosomal replication initiator protein DnaA [Candidatus Limnocylindrales bacterium]
MTPQEIWNAAYHQLELQLDRASFETWVRGAVLAEAHQDQQPLVLVLSLRNAFAVEQMQTRLLRSVTRIVRDVAGEPVDLRFVVARPADSPAPAAMDDAMPLFRLLAQQTHEQASAAPTPLHRQVARPNRPELPESDLNPRFTFDRFMSGSENQMLVAAARAVAEQPAAAYNPLFLWGGVGLGKTHLLHAIAHVCRERGLRVIYVPSEAFTNDLVDAIRQRTTAMFRERYRSADVLLVDDIQFIAGKESTQEEFFHTFNALATFNKQIVLASDRPPRDMKTLEARLRSRFEGGLVMDIQPPDLETRIAILANWAEERGLNAPPAVLRHIAGRVKSNVREMEGVFNHMVAALRFSQSAATPDMADSLIDGYRRPRQQVTLQQVVEVVARHHGLESADLIGPRRHGPVNHARQIAMYLARELTGASLPQIGDAFGGRTHSTVLHSCGRVANDLPDDPLLQAIVDDLRQALQRA